MKNDISVRPGQLWKNKKSGNTLLIEDIVSYSSSEKVEIQCLTSTGKYKVIYLGGLKNYELVRFDLTSLVPNFLEYAKYDATLRNGIETIARRLHPGGYFHVGDYVYIVSFEFIRDSISFRNPMEHPYKITDISPDKEIPLVEILKLESVYYAKQIMTIPMYRDRISSVDAYSCLRRYDLPY